jgi:hypothetical protein
MYNLLTLLIYDFGSVNYDFFPPVDIICTDADFSTLCGYVKNVTGLEDALSVVDCTLPTRSASIL